MRKTALITGGTRGIGLGIAKSLAKDGYNLALNGVRKESEVKNIISELKSKTTDVIYCQGDISSTKARESIIRKIKRHFKRLDVLVNNAGVAPKVRDDILNATEESFEYVLKTNLQGPYFLSQSIAKWMINQKNTNRNFKGCIINVTSISSTVASTNRGEYCISKAGLSMMTKLFAARMSEFDIPVYEIQPGIIDTDMTAGVKDKYDKLFSEGLTLQKRWGIPSDIGKAVSALAKNNFPYSTGQVIIIDGGLTLSRL